MKFSECITDIIDNRGRNPEYYVEKSNHPILDNYLIKNNLHPDISNANRFLDDKLFNSFLRGYVKNGMVVMTLVGNGIGNVTTIDNENIAIIQNTIGFVTNPEIVTDRFLYYYFLQNQQTIKNFDRGSGQPSIKRTDLLNMDVEFPSLENQKKIAEILSSLDDKIELNNKINANLEQQAQALFKSWFIDFEPFDGKMPAGWKEGKLSDISSYSSDKIEVTELTLKTYYSTENMLPNKKGIEDASSLPSIKQTTRCYPGETIISNIRPYFKKIYYCSEELAGCSTDVLCFKPRDPNYSEYLYQTLYSDDFFAYMVLGSKGTKMPRGDKQQIMNYAISIPDEQYLLKYKTFAAPIFSQIDLNRRENKRLSAIRDTLLPKLMNGEIKTNSIIIGKE